MGWMLSACHVWRRDGKAFLCVRVKVELRAEQKLGTWLEVSFLFLVLELRAKDGPALPKSPRLEGGRASWCICARQRNRVHSEGLVQGSKFSWPSVGFRWCLALTDALFHVRLGTSCRRSR